MGSVSPALTARVNALADDLAARGIVTSDRWRQASHEVPRYMFVPPTGWASPDYPGGTDHAINREADPAGWWQAVYTDTAIILQTDDGATSPASGTGAPTSSISAPGVVMAFLELLDVGDHDRVLEIGTGSGWTAALLSWRVGEDNVTSIEVDPEVAAAAAENLKAAGYAPRLIVGDGAAGGPDGAPYDRVHVTCAVRRVPHAWVEQTRPGGVIVLPWSPDAIRGYRVRLDVVGDGTAVGRFRGPATYMMLRSQRGVARWNPHDADTADRTTTRLDPRTIAEAGAGAHLAITAQVPHAGSLFAPDDDGGSLLLFESGNPDGSWAACDVMGVEKFEVHQYGDRRLWNEVEQAFLRWISWGRPGEERFGMTVSRGEHRIWLDSADRGPIWTVAPG